MQLHQFIWPLTPNTYTCLLWCISGWLVWRYKNISRSCHVNGQKCSIGDFVLVKAPDQSLDEARIGKIEAVHNKGGYSTSPTSMSRFFLHELVLHYQLCGKWCWTFNAYTVTLTMISSVCTTVRVLSEDSVLSLNPVQVSDKFLFGVYRRGSFLFWPQ